MVINDLSEFFLFTAILRYYIYIYDVYIYIFDVIVYDKFTEMD